MKQKPKWFSNLGIVLRIVIFAGLLVALDQFTKIWAVDSLKGKDSIVLLSGILEFQYLENCGMAFGLLQNAQWFFFIVTGILLAVLFFIIWRTPNTKRFFAIRLSEVLILGGAVGNFIDRASQKYVVDFIYFKLIDFPIFNVADIFVTVGMILTIILLLFVYREEELRTLIQIKKKEK